MISFLKNWRKSYRVLQVLFLVGLATAVWSWRHTTDLPPPSELDLDFDAQPAQTYTDTPDFKFSWKSNNYLIFPKAKYYIRGLVVSHNSVGGITDAYHSADAVDLKDLCVVWGENAQTGAYKTVKFWSGPWTCNYRYEGSGTSFNGDEMSNNHLLAGTEQIASDIRETRIGDQIEISGFLVDYASEKNPDQRRVSSLVRDDTGDGACEVLFVTEYRIVKTANKDWRSLFSKSQFFTIAMFGVLILSWTALPYLEYRFGL